MCVMMGRCFIPRTGWYRRDGINDGLWPWLVCAVSIETRVGFLIPNPYHPLAAFLRLLFIQKAHATFSPIFIITRHFLGQLHILFGSPRREQQQPCEENEVKKTGGRKGEA